MPLLCGFDTETTSLDPDKGYVTEIGVVLFSTEDHQPIKLFGTLVKVPEKLSAEIVRITGITDDMLEKYGVPQADALRAVLSFMEKADFVVAHNAPFDKGFLDAWCKREGKPLVTKPFVDSRTDLPPAAYSLGKSASLTYLAADHGFLYDSHRAVNDVLALLKILDRYPIEEILERARTPNVEVRAVVSFNDKHLAKERGYYWKPELKLWIKPLKLNMVAAEKEQAPFPVVLMTEGVTA